MRFRSTQPYRLGEEYCGSDFPRVCAGRFLANLRTTRVSAGRILFWCERIDDRLKAWIASQRIPKGMKTQIAVADMAARQGRCLSQSLNGAIFLTSPCVNHCE